MKSKIQLITYADRLTGAGLKALKKILDNELKNVFHLQYEEIAKDSTTAIENILTYFKVPYDHDKVIKISTTEKNSKNLLHKGIAGKGAKELTAEQIEAIYSLILPILSYEYVNTSHLM